jgi:HK97 family phage major capsid protein
MPEDLKTTIEAIEKGFVAFKAEHAKELAEIKAKGEASAEAKAAADKTNAALTELQTQHATMTVQIAAQEKQLHEAETILARVGTVDPRGPRSDEAAKEEAGARVFLARARRQSVDEVQVTPDDLTAVRAYKPAFLAFLRRGGHNGDTLPQEIRAAMSVGSDPDGGYLVPPDMSGRMVSLIYESSPIRQIASVTTTRGNEITGRNDLAEADAAWVGETAARPATTTPTVGEWKIPVHEMYANPGATQTLIDDSMVSMEDWLNGKVADKMARLEATAFVSGNGVGKPRGFLDYAHASAPTAAAWQRVEQTNTGVNGGFHATLPGDVFHTTIGKTKAAYLAAARWVMNRTVLAATRKIKDGDGTYLWEKSFQAGQPFQLLGYPVTLAEDMPAIATDSLSMGFGDFRGYQIVDRIGIRVLRDPYTNKPYVQFYTTKRVGGDVVNFEALKLIKFAA